MPIIEYACLMDGVESLHVAIPGGCSENDNQYVLAFEGRSSLDIACICGDWEWEAVSGCISNAADYLADTAVHPTRFFHVGRRYGSKPAEDGFSTPASLEIVRSPDSDVHRLTLRLSAEAQRPYLLSARWRGIDDRTFRIYRSDAELSAIGRLFRRLPEAEFEQVFASKLNSWFVPPFLTPTSGAAYLALPRRIEQATSHIQRQCPAGLAAIWLPLIRRLDGPGVDNWTTAACAECGKFFARDVGWMKRCLGCYRGEASSAFSQQAIDEASCILPWLER